MPCGVFKVKCAYNNTHTVDDAIIDCKALAPALFGTCMANTQLLFYKAFPIEEY
jgi:hypothetical protein